MGNRKYGALWLCLYLAALLLMCFLFRAGIL